ncbi:hypothetical protein ABWED_0317 [Acinetobacter lwoffii]|nr:hypothetical protein ABWED_0317 [Acinetobacter lwoffii]
MSQIYNQCLQFNLNFRSLLDDLFKHAAPVKTEPAYNL